MRLRAVTRNDSLWAPAGHETAWEQFALTKPPRKRAGGKAAPWTVARESKKSIHLSRGDITAVLDLKSGNLRTLSSGGTPIIQSGPQANFIRGWTDNDGVKGKEEQWTSTWKPLGRWMKVGLGDLRVDSPTVRLTRKKDGVTAMRSSRKIRFGKTGRAVTHTQTYTFLADGRLRVDNQFAVPPALADLPRLGVQLELAPGFEHLEWFGLGPHENYSDRKAGAWVGRFSGTVAGQYEPYIVPQEHGNKEELRWLTLKNESGTGLKVSAPKLFSGSASHFTADDLIAAYHTHELAARPEVVLTLDAMQRGLGTRSCGPDTRPEYCIPAGKHDWTYELQVL